MDRKVTNFLRSFAIIGLMTMGMIGQVPWGVNADDCWCGKENPRDGEKRIWHCQSYVFDFAYINPQHSEKECMSACPEHHYWGGYKGEGARAECEKEPIKQNWPQPYRVDIDDTPYEFFQ